MKMIALLGFLCLISAQALACRPTPKAGDLLDCYNGIARMTSSGGHVKPKALSVQPKTPVPRASAQIDDLLDYENKKLDTSVRSLCRGC